MEQRPRLKAGCRLAPAGDVLLIPEGALRLQGPGVLIIGQCDGEKSVPEIVSALMSNFPNADPERVAEETSSFLSRLAERGVVEFI